MVQFVFFAAFAIGLYALRSRVLRVLPLQSASVPVCSTVFELQPSMPTHSEESVFGVLVQSTAVTIHEPWTWVKPEPVTAYPAQMVL